MADDRQRYYEAHLNRNIKTNEALLRYLSSREFPIDLESIDSNVAVCSNEESPKQKRKYRKSSLSPSRQSLRIREREKHLNSSSSDIIETVESREYQDKRQRKDKGKRRKSAEPSTISRQSMEHPSTSKYLKDDLLRATCISNTDLPLVKRTNDMDMATDYTEIPGSPHLIEEDTNNAVPQKGAHFMDLFGKKNILMTILILAYAIWIGYHNDECCKKAISKIVFTGVVIVLAVNVLYLLAFKRRDIRR